MKRNCLFALFWVLGPLCSFGQTSSPPVTDGLVAWYPFNGNTNDESGNALHGTGTDVTLTADRFGNADKAFDFNGSTSFIEIADNETFFRQGSVTVSVWYYRNPGYPISVIVSKPFTSGWSNSWVLADGYNQNHDLFAIVGSGPGQGVGLVPNIPMTNPVWRHAVLTYDHVTGKVRLYENGVLLMENTHNEPLGYDTSPIQIGREIENGLPDFYLSGKIDDVAIYNRAISAVEVSRLYLGDIAALSGSGKALKFEGGYSGQFVEMPSEAVRPREAFTMEFWVKIGQATPGNLGKGLFGNSYWNDPNGSGAYFEMYNNSSYGFLLFTEDGYYGAGYSTEITPVTAGQWEHVAATYSAASQELKMYINGVLKQTVRVTGNVKWKTDQNPSFSIGSALDKQIDNKRTNAEMDEVRWWNVALTEADIKQRMCRRIQSDDPFYDNLLVYYDFDQENAFTLIDVKSGVNGRLMGNPTWVMSGVPTADVSNAGPDQVGASTCNATTTTLAANTPSQGTGEWSIVSGEGGSFGDPTSPGSTFNGVEGTTYILKWTITNAPCAASEDEVTISFSNYFSLAQNGDEATLSIAGTVVNQPLAASDCRRIATISGTDLSNGTDPFLASVIVENEVRYFGHQPYVQRHFVMTPGGTTPTTTTLTLYVSKAEMQAFNEESTVKLPAEGTDPKDKLRIWVWHGTVVPGSPDETIEPGAANINWDEEMQVWKISFEVSSFSSFYITAEDAISLPVSLAAFKATLDGERNADVRWATSEESNASHFNIQRSEDATTWHALGRVAAAGESTGRRSYQYTDRLSEQNLKSDIAYYRLEMVDFDGSKAYSRTSSVQIDRTEGIVIFPNPIVGKTIKVSFREAIPEITLTDLSGRAIPVETRQISANLLEVSPKSAMTSGLYFINTMQGGVGRKYKVIMVD